MTETPKETKKTKRQVHTQCPECESENIIKDRKRAEKSCGDCGLVLTSPYPYVGGRRVRFAWGKPYEFADDYGYDIGPSIPWIIKKFGRGKK